MDSKRPLNNMKKRPLEECYTDRPRKIPSRDPKMEDDTCGEKLFQFRVLLPNSTTVELKLTELRNEIPVEELIDELRKKYNILVKQRRSPESRRRINWDYEDIHFTDAESRRIMPKVNLRNFKPNKWYFLWLHDGSAEPDVYEGMWDLTPDTDLLKELPDDYTFETALADLIDNSLQALWSNGKGERRLISIRYSTHKISIFDSGPGMDGSDGNLVKWGKMGASLHRSARGKAIGGEPPYLMPFFGMFGYGGPVATMCLGKLAVVSSKTKNCNKVFTLHLEREALVNASRSEHCWRTKGGTRDPTESEKDKAPHGSFTKVEIFEPKVKTLDIKSFRCKLKDIYFPYIQCDEVSGKTSTPVEFQVNGENLAEIEGGEVATTNLHSCNGPDFVVQLHFSISQSSSSMAGQNQRVFLEANARLKCVYFPITKGEESIQKILDSLTSDGFGTRENFESFSRVSVRRLGRLLPDTRWALLPFMEPKPIKGEKGHSLKRNCSRVKCFIDTDSGFNPTPHKTDLAQHHPYTKALKNFGNKAPENENEVEVEISRDGKKMTVTELEKQYTNWISEMHDCYDDEITGGLDEPIIVLVSSMRKKLGITAEVVRVHKKIMRKGQCWTAGQKIKVLKGACPGCHNSNVYATLEYIILQGLPGDACGEARLICRPYDKPENKGCHLGNNNNTIDIRDSLVLPIRIIDSEKCIPVDEVEWGKKLEAHNQKSPSSIDLLSDIECQKLEIEGAFPTLVQAGDAPPMNIVAVIRPKSFRVENCSNRLDQKFICKDNLEIILEIKYRADEKRKGEFDHIYSARVSPSSHQGLHGIYLFPLRMKQPLLFKKAGFLTFSFFLKEQKDIHVEQIVRVRASAEVARWEVVGCNNDELRVRVGSCFKPLSVECYDKYDNCVPFASVPKLKIILSSNGTILTEAHSTKVDITLDKSKILIEEIFIESGRLDEILPNYEATLNISRVDKAFSVSLPCRVIPGIPEKITLHSSLLKKQLKPGQIIEDLALEVFDEYNNHVEKDETVTLRVDGFSFTDGSGVVRGEGTDCTKKVDAKGFVDLGNTLKVSKGYCKNVFLSVISKEKEIFKQWFVTVLRELRPVTKVFKNCEAGSQLENIVFEITDSQGNVDESIHDEDKHGQPHTLSILSDSFEVDNTVRYSFRRGCCTIRSIPLPRREGIFSLSAVHSRYPELKTVVKVEVENTRVENPRLCENYQVLRHSPSSNSQETRGAFSPQSSLKQVHIENAQEEEENHRSTRNHEDMMNVVISNHRPCESNEILRHSPSLKVPKETHGAFSPRSSQKQVNVENARKENFKRVRNDDNMGNFIYSNHKSRGNDQFPRQSPPLKASLETHGAFSPRSTPPAYKTPMLLEHVDTPLQVHTENGEENHRSTRNDEDMGNVFSDDRACGNDQFLLHTPSSRATHETLSPPSSMKLIPYNCSSPVFITPKMDHTDAQIENSATSIQDHGSLSQQELGDALVNCGMAVNDHDRELGRLRLYRRQIHQDITNLQASVDRDFINVSTTPTCDKELVSKQIESKKESAASVMCKIPFESRTQDVLGVVALLGTVRSIELSRMLAEYLGEDQMLAIACRNYKAAYHLKANSLGETISRGYHAVCLEDISARFLEPSSDPQQLLPLKAPILPNGIVPLGFLGYAVNMMDIEESHIQWRTESGYGLRETLFYRLFGELQVYKDEPSMFSAQSCIKEGALSLDGCITRGNGLISLGHKEPPEILFPVNRPLSARVLRAEQSLAEKRLEMKEINKRIDEEESAYIRAKAELFSTGKKFNSLSQNGSHRSR
ncbi:hypothetical protein ACS0TY_000106 [Phlomoides rotata]